MNLTILGPWGVYPESGSCTSSFLLNEDDFHLLIDCGSGVLSQVQKYIPIQRLDGVILSHYHPDHCCDIGPLQYSMLIQHRLGTRRKSLPIYGHDNDPNKKFESLTFAEFTKGMVIEEDQQVKIGPWDVSFCKTTHPAYCLAMKFTNGKKTLVYTADTEWSEAVVDFAKGVDMLIADTSFYQEQLGKFKGHMTAGQSGKLAKLTDVQQLILTHLPHYGDHDVLLKQAQKEYSGDISLAQAGKKVQV